MEHTTHTNNEEQAIDLSVLLRRMLRALRRLWPVCLALIVLCAAVMGWRAHRTFRPMYRSEAVFSVSLSFIGGTDVSSYSQYYNKSAAQQVTDTFPYLLSSDRMQELLRQRLGTASINGSISASPIPDTSFFVLTVESPGAQDAYDILRAVIDVYPQVNRLVLGETQLVVNQEPSLPDAPYNSDPWVRSTVKGAFLGLVLDLAVLIIAAALRRTVSSTGDVKRLVSLPCLASIPRTAPKRRKSGPQQGLLITHMQTDSAFCEAYRLLRLKLLRQLKPQDKIIMVTSSIPSEGKSSVSVNLALSLAREGKKVLLIDGDLRGPSDKALLGLTKPSDGLGQCLSGSLGQVHFLRYEDTSLYAFAGSEPIHTPMNLLQYDKLEALMNTLRPMFDYIVLDTPPCGSGHLRDPRGFCRHYPDLRGGPGPGRGRFPNGWLRVQLCHQCPGLRLRLWLWLRIRLWLRLRLRLWLRQDQAQERRISPSQVPRLSAGGPQLIKKGRRSFLAS